MPTALQTPINQGEAQRVGKRLYRKQVLPVGSVEHDGRTLQFTKPYLEKLADNFTAGKMDQVPFTLVDEVNKHNDDPERVRGDVTGVEVQDDGLYALIEMSEKGEALVGDNLKLGVSARIGEDGTVLKHVAGTLDPVVKGMKPWEKVDLADTGEKLIDLSGGEFTVPSAASHSSQTVSTDAQLTADETVRLRALLAKDGGGDGGAAGGKKTDDDVIDSLITDSKKDKEPVALAKEHQDAIDLAKSQAKDAKDAADRATADLAKARWDKERDDYLRAGVPPAMLDLAEPHLSTASAVIELSNANSTASAMRKMLEEAKGTIDLAERGGHNSADQESEAKDLAKDEVWAKV